LRYIAITLYPRKEDVKKKDSPRPSERCGCGDLHPAPPHP